LLVTVGAERAYKTMLHAPRSRHFVFASLSLLNHSWSLVAAYTNLKIAAAGSSVTALCFALTSMERLLSPCTRFYDMLQSRGYLQKSRGLPGGLRELNLDVSTEAFLSAERAFAYADLYAMLANENVVVWLTPYAAVMPNMGRGIDYWKVLDGSCHIYVKADGKGMFGLARSPEHLSDICNVVLRLLAASVVQSVCLDSDRNSGDSAVINADTLANLMEQCHSVKILSLKYLRLDENQIRVLGAYSRPDLEIKLDHCTFTSAGTSALVEVLGRNQGPTKLDCCDINYSVLANALRENSGLKSLAPLISSNLEVSNREVFAIAGALKENKGLVELDLSNGAFWENDEMWGAVCGSLETHPTLEILNLNSAFTAPAVIKSRIQALLDMMHVNISIHTIHLDSSYSQHELFQSSVIPFLETNRLRPRVRAVQRTSPIAYRAKVLGRALLSARTDANSFWMLLIGNVEVVFCQEPRRS
jgi:hypothetical protein